MVEFQKGDVIELVSMPDDPDPIPAGTRGIVQYGNEIAIGDRAYVQYSIEWAIDRSLQAVVPPDDLRLVKRAGETV